MFPVLISAIPLPLPSIILMQYEIIPLFQPTMPPASLLISPRLFEKLIIPSLFPAIPPEPKLPEKLSPSNPYPPSPPPDIFTLD